MRVTVERMEARDVEAGAAPEVEAVPPIPRGPHAEAGPRLYEELEAPLTRAWAARDDAGRTIGHLVAMHAADELHVLNVATVPAERRRGVGRGLVDAALAYAMISSVRLVILEVRRSNRDAIRL